MKLISRRPSGFSLAEVVLATGVCSVALLSLIGVLGVSLTAERNAARDTALAAMSAQIVTVLAKQPFEELGKTVAPGSGPVFCFDTQGVLLPGVSNLEDLQAAYVCQVTTRPCEETRNPTTGDCNLVRLEMLYTWEVNAANGSAHRQRDDHQRLYASIARY